MEIDYSKFQSALAEAARPYYRGRVEIVSGVMVEATGVPAAMGEVCRIDRGRLGPIEAEVVGFRGSSTLLMPHGDLNGIAPRQSVVALRRPFQVVVSKDLVGRVLDGFGRPIDGKSAVQGSLREVRSEAPDPLSRVPIRCALQTGVRAIDALNTLGRGQRVGIFAGSGVGKSTLLGQITRGTDAGVIVCCMVGERGREVQDFIADVLGEEGRKRAIIVVATSDRSPIERYLAPFVAVTIAESFRDDGADVLLLMDSVTRFAAAAREIGLAAGEPPTVRGYPPSFFAVAPRLVERMGRTQRGTITGLITILLSGDDPHEPVADTMRGLLDGHLWLSRELAQRGHFPAIDVPASLSRLMPQLADKSDLARAAWIREALVSLRDGKDLIEVGAYKSGTNPKLDQALSRAPALDAFLRQPLEDHSSFEETRELLSVLTQGVVSQ